MGAILELESRDMQLWGGSRESRANMVLAVAPKVVDWRRPMGVLEQEIEGVTIGYLLGAKKGKPGSGDVGSAYIYSLGNWQVTATLTEDYLSKPSGVDDGWGREVEILKKQFGKSDEYGSFVDLNKLARIESSDPIVWSEYPDVAGADLSRLLAIASLKEVTDAFTNQVTALENQKNIALALVELESDGVTFPVLEKASVLMLQALLQTRNMWRWGALDAGINDPNSDWKNYWMNAAICASLTIVNTGGSANDEESKVAFAWARSLADVQLKFDAMTGYKKPFVDADVNAVFDRYATGRDENGLTDPKVYGEKTSDRGLYMTWGDPFGHDRRWLERAWPRADTGSMSFQADSRWLQVTAMTDGLYNYSRDPDRRRQVDEYLDRRLSGYRNKYQPAFVLGQLSRQDQFPTDDYFYLQVSQALKR